MVEAILCVIAILIAVLVLKEHTPKILSLLESGNISDIEDYIRSEGEEGELVLILLQVVETVAIVLPALPVYICAGVVYGKLKGFLMCYLTNIVMNIIIFSAARRLKSSTAQFTHALKNQKLEELIHKAKHIDRAAFRAFSCMLSAEIF